VRVSGPRKRGLASSLREHRGVDRTTLVAGLVTIVAGLLLLLDRLDEIDLGLGYGLPLLIAAVGAILLTAGLEGPRRRS
jgi:hypothetical protein